MPSFWLTFKPLGPKSPQGWPIEHLRDLIRRVEIDPEHATEWWRIASPRAARVGDRVFVFKQGDDPRGVFGIGRIVEGPETRRSDTDPEARPRACIRFDRLVDPTREFLLPLEAIADVIPGTLVRAMASGHRVPNEITVELEKRIAASATVPKHGERGAIAFDPSGQRDEREKVLRAIEARRGQPAFRTMLLKAYGGRCAVTGCAIEAVLDAAHLSPYQGTITNHVTNGIILRADIHTLYDCGLLAIEPETRTVAIASVLFGSDYERFSGLRVSEPMEANDRPGLENLKACFRRFKINS
jgi:hypothetical protein